MDKAWGFVLIIALLQAFDGWTTYQCLKRGLGTEANPVVAWMMKSIGVYWTLLALKTGVTAAFAWAAWTGAFTGWWFVGLVVACGCYAALTAHNYDVLYKLKGKPPAPG